MVCKCLDQFCLYSRQKVNVEKSKIFFSDNVSAQLAQAISNWSGFTKTNNLGKYMGVPLLHNKVSILIYSYVLEKIQERLFGWKVDRLSMAGRVTFCKAVLSALPIYTM